ncbi:MAG TPA: succinate dehydrogenase, cytochrome b556 subunit [Rhodobacteraceae bacterium]|nr:succinate dehydrogenase, cytochrome b556 subunit [Paracoccaceae bacterium]
MADVNRGKRPLSPHLSIYRPLWTMILSITHRITGVGLAVSITMITWWFLALAISEEYFEFANALMTSVVGGFILIISLWALSFHFCNGIRHLFWDAGKGLELETAYRSGLAVMAGSVVLTVIGILVATGVF